MGLPVDIAAKILAIQIHPNAPYQAPPYGAVQAQYGHQYAQQYGTPPYSTSSLVRGGDGGDPILSSPSPATYYGQQYYGGFGLDNSNHGGFGPGPGQ